MEESNASTPIKGKPGPKPKTQGPSTQELLERIQVLEDAFCRIATHTGNGNFLAEYGLKRWEPQKKHMTKYAS